MSGSIFNRNKLRKHLAFTHERDNAIPFTDFKCISLVGEPARDIDDIALTCLKIFGKPTGMTHAVLPKEAKHFALNGFKVAISITIGIAVVVVFTQHGLVFWKFFLAHLFVHTSFVYFKLPTSIPLSAATVANLNRRVNPRH